MSIQRVQDIPVSLARTDELRLPCSVVLTWTPSIDPETTEITGQPWFESTEWKEAMTPLPKIFNIAMQEEHIARIEVSVLEPRLC